jgi:serine/arginine repetitive matrix protein 2
VVSPLHTITAAPPVSPTHNADKSSKASALLDSVVDSILSPAYPAAAVREAETAAPASHSKEGVSPTSRRNRDLAQALFGTPDRDWDRKVSQPAKLSLSQSATVPPVVLESLAEVSGYPSSADTEAPMASPHKSRHQSTPKSPQVNEAELAREVQRKTEAAMMALRRTPSQPDSGRIGVTGSISRRRVSPAQISNPKLVSASTSVDTIPLRSPSVSSGNVQATSRLGQRIKRITGTLRTKVPAQSDEMTPISASESRTPPSSQTAYYDPTRLRVPGEPSAITSATEVGRFKVPVPSPPASAGPGLRGFMARFLKPRTNEPQVEQERGMSPQLQPTSPLASLATPQARSAPLPPRAFSPPPEPPLNPGPPARHPRSTPPPSLRLAKNMDTSQSTPAIKTDDVPATNGTDDDAALKQLFAAAVDLGLDQGALNDLLARSNSTRSTAWTMLTRNTSSSTNTRYDHTPDSYAQDGVYSPVTSESRPSVDTISSRTDDVPVRKPSARRATDHLRRPRNNQDESTAAFNAVVRRTIIFPSESKSATIDLNVLMRKHSQSSRRRRSAGSVASVSTRSVHDRVPTPPPPRSPTGHRFSTDSSPPVPQLPPSFSSHSENLLQPQSAPAGPMEKSNSTYDSL